MNIINIWEFLLEPLTLTSCFFLSPIHPPQAVDAKHRAMMEEVQRQRQEKNRREQQQWAKRKVGMENEARMREHEERLKQLSVSVGGCEGVSVGVIMLGCEGDGLLRCVWGVENEEVLGKYMYKADSIDAESIVHTVIQLLFVHVHHTHTHTASGITLWQHRTCTVFTGKQSHYIIMMSSHSGKECTCTICIVLLFKHAWDTCTCSSPHLLVTLQYHSYNS